MIYLDNAATSLPKPSAVYHAVRRAMQCMASPGRGGHRQAMLAAETVFLCREQAAKMFQVEKPEYVVFTFNATHALNIAIKTLVQPGSTVLISGYEHNAVVRPLLSVGHVQIRVAKAPLFRPDILLEQMELLMGDDVDTVICTHVSNVYGYILPIQEIADLCRKKNKALIVDASQSAGCLPISMKEWGAKFVAFPGHKGLHGPQGTGILLCDSDAVKPILEGGTGSASASLTMPDFLPDRLEAGTHNVSGVAGLLEGLRFVESKKPENILRHERELLKRTKKGLATIPGLEVFSTSNIKEQTGVLSFRMRDVECEEIGNVLTEANIAVRAGLHCAPLAHRTGGTFESGTVRLGFSIFNQISEIERFLTIMTQHYASTK